eukprot:TRINITY_DN1725_c0_g1_i1.p1 TRINITY_DN1725_c0_g1~~TRINITY_DN1725_c0_g1_i1.p1  ORF type:complete len:565 (+),score=45.44 TRINITY_DN1725_c0_g1_i1:234-1928(+)
MVVSAENRKPFSYELTYEYFCLTIIHTFVDCLIIHYRSRIMLEHRLMIRRMLSERILYSEFGTIFLEDDRPQELETKISIHITNTIHFMTFTVPDVISTAYSLFIEASKLMSEKQSIDPIMIIHPIILEFIKRIYTWSRHHLFEKKKIDYEEQNTARWRKYFLDCVQGLSDVQLFNIQSHQLTILDTFIEEELRNTASFSILLWKTTYSIFSVSLFEFMLEIYISSIVMERKNFSHQHYRKLQESVNHTKNLLLQLWRHSRFFMQIIHVHEKVTSVLNVPNWLHELDKDNFYHNILEIKELTLSNLLFAYQNESPAISIEGDITILPGQIYCIIGQNRSGKSTLAHILCKMYHPQRGNIFLNGIPYSKISRLNIRSLISYVQQKPYIFAGTVIDNIRIGNPEATEDQIFQAAEAAGVFVFGGEDTQVTSKRKEILYQNLKARGDNVSGGFAQSIALARVFVRPATKAIILDESFSQMDTVKKNKIVFPHIFEFASRNNITLFLICHDLRMTEHVDQVIILEGGSIVGMGSHKQLSSQSPVYQSLLNNEKPKRKHKKLANSQRKI